MTSGAASRIVRAKAAAPAGRCRERDGRRGPRTQEVSMAKAGARSLSGAARSAAADSERRRSTRAPFVVRVDYGTVDAFFSEFTSDVNEGGMFIETETPQPPGTARPL